MTGELSPIDKAKFVAAKRSVDFVEDGMRVGLGTGSTAAWLVRCLGERVRERGLGIRGVPTSSRTAALAREEGIEVVTLDTGRLFPESYEVWRRTEETYGKRIHAKYPQAEALENLIEDQGIDGFYRLGKPDKDGDYEVQHSASVIVIGPDARIHAKLSPPLPPADTAEYLARKRITYIRAQRNN